MGAVQHGDGERARHATSEVDQADSVSVVRVTASDPRLLVLHGLRLKGFGEPADVAAIVDLDVDIVAKHLDTLQTEGLVLRREGRLVGWALTADGRAEQERLLAKELAD